MSPRGRSVPLLGPPRRKGRLKHELRALRSLAPYLWPRDSLELRARVLLALAFLVAGKLINISVPLFYKNAVDALSPANLAIAVPVGLIVAYGVARVMSQAFNELRNAVFAKVSQRAIRRLALTAFSSSTPSPVALGAASAAGTARRPRSRMSGSRIDTGSVFPVELCLE